MKINKKDILKKYVLPILIFGGIIFLATMKGSTIEKFGGGEFNEENCIRTIKRSARNKLNGCKSWDNEESSYQDCNEKGQKQQDAVIQWAENQCANKKQYKDAEKKYGSKFINWSKSQAKKYAELQKDSYKKLGPAVLVQGGGKGLAWGSAAAYAPMQVALEV